MAMSRSARITLLLVIDIFFFFVELIVGEQRFSAPLGSTLTLLHRLCCWFTRTRG